MAGNLEERIGELIGTLKALTPAIERLEERERETENELRETSTILDGIKSDFETHKTTIWARYNSLNDAVVKLEVSVSKLSDQLEAKLAKIGETIGALTGERKTQRKVVWDIVKMVLAAALGALATKFL
jgi:predicted  nucleic acid-binding Zn-ribbon protein